MVSDEVSPYELQPVESRDPWIDVQVEKLRYVFLIWAVVLSTLGYQALDNTDATKESLEATAKAALQYHELDQAELGSLSEALATYPQFAEVYQYLEQKVRDGEASQFDQVVVQQVLNRELWRYFRTPLPLYLSISQAKDKLNYPQPVLRDVGFADVQLQDPAQSVGMTDLRANRITSEVYQYLPQYLQQQLELDPQLGFVTPDSLAQAVTTWEVSPVESTKRAVDVYLAVLVAYQSRIDAAAQEAGWSAEQKIYAAAMVACCSTEQESDGGTFAFALLSDPHQMERHWRLVPQAIKDLIVTQETTKLTDQSRQNKVYSIIRQAFVPSSVQ